MRSLFFLAVLVAASCSPVTSQPCSRDADCGFAQVCLANVCRGVRDAGSSRGGGSGGGVGGGAGGGGGGTTSTGGGSGGGGGVGGGSGGGDAGQTKDAGVSTDAGSTVIDAGSSAPLDAGAYPAFRTCSPPGTRQVTNGGTAGPSSAPTACDKSVRASSLQGLQKISLGTHSVNETLTFSVPPSTGGITVVQQAVSANTSVGFQGTGIPNASVPHRLTTPAGLMLYDDNATPPADATTANIWSQAPTANTGVVTLPNTSAAFRLMTAGALPQGTWSVTVNDYAAECAGTANLCTSGASTTGTYDVTVLLRRGPVPSTGTIDVAIYLVTNSFTATTAMSSTKMTRMLDSLATIYARAGLCLGTVSFYDVPAWAKTKYATGVRADDTGVCSDLNQMFTLSKAGQNTLNFFFVDAISQTSTGGGTIVGIDGAIPGPSSVNGTVKSGAVVNIADLASGFCLSGSVDPFLCGADAVAYIAAHEGGHWLGLYHTTETNGLIWDPLTDTPKCTCSTTCVSATAASKCCDFNTGKFPDGGTCTASFTQMSGSVCSSASKPQCQGADDLMFWVLDSTSAGNVSAEQGAVIRANPLVQ